MEEPPISSAFAALGHPVRLALFRNLLDHGVEGRGPSALAAEVGIPRNLVSYHLRPLVACRLVGTVRRGREVNYSIDRGALSEFALQFQSMALSLR